MYIDDYNSGISNGKKVFIGQHGMLYVEKAESKGDYKQIALFVTGDRTMDVLLTNDDGEALIFDNRDFVIHRDMVSIPLADGVYCIRERLCSENTLKSPDPPIDTVFLKKKNGHMIISRSPFL